MTAATVHSVWARTPTPPKPGRKTARTVARAVDPDTMTICDDPMPAHRASPGCKYDATFGALKPGQAIKCQPDDVNRIANALRKYVEADATLVVRSIRDYGDGQGRVWLVKAAKPASKAKAGKP